mgnify:CR=1 FL=1
MGHFYSAMVILGSASVLHMEVLSLGYAIRKDTTPKTFSWLDVYWYAVGTYITIPWFFFRRSMIENDVYFKSDLLLLLCYEYHSLISQIAIFFGIVFTVFKLNRGYVKHQLRRTLWTIVSLGYVFMLSTAQIYNLYEGYIWVIVPLTCVRFNGWITKQIH